MTDATEAGRSEALDRFRQALAERPELRERLGSIVLPDDFAAAAISAAAEIGIVLDRDMVLPPSRPDPIDIARFLPAGHLRQDWLRQDWPPPGWLPARSVETGGAPAFDWTWFGSAPLTDPFYEDTVRRIGSRPFARMMRVRTDLATLVAGAVGEATPVPDGLVFHMSRCGSTLVAQMLAAVPGHVMVSEPEPLDAVVRWAMTSGAPHDEQVAALRAIVAALGRDRDGASTRYFLKLDSWHGFALPLFRAAFPDTPWLFLYRDPAEVLVSLKRRPGIQSAPGSLPVSMIGFDPAEATSLDDYAARLFAALFDRVVATMPQHATGTGLGGGSGGGGLLVHYPDLVAAMEGAIPAHFGFVPTPREAAAMAAAARRDAKHPDRPFATDSAAKRAEVSPDIAAAVDRWLAGPYAALQRMTAGA